MEKTKGCPDFKTTTYHYKKSALMSGMPILSHTTQLIQECCTGLCICWDEKMETCKKYGVQYTKPKEKKTEIEKKKLEIVKN